MKAFALLGVPLALLGCRPQPPAGDPGAEAAPVPTNPPAAAASPVAPSGSNDAEATIALPGEYRIAGVDGAGIDQPYAITASITRDRIHVTADCLNFGWTYRALGDRIATKRVAVEGCARGLTAAEEAVVAAIDSAGTVAPTPAGAIELRGGGHSVTLFSQ
jgi:hypothetical protein